jgi:transcriptional regulator with XRE-family HTH domain
MAKIDGSRLKALRSSKGWSQEELAEKTKGQGQPKIDKQTISRLERGASGNARGRTVAQLARALGAEPAMLTGELALPETKSDPLAPKVQFNVRISQAARNALILVSQSYPHIEPSQIVELAPFLFCWAAEVSLRHRREAVNKFESARDELKNLWRGMPHMPALEDQKAPGEAPFEDEMVAAERASIVIRDLFGTSIAEDTGFFGEPDEDPFSVFLRTLADELDETAEFKGWSHDGTPSYTVCVDAAAKFVGNNRSVAEGITKGWVALNEMPKELLGPSGSEKVEERAEWVLEKTRAYAEQLRTLHAKLEKERVK